MIEEWEKLGSRQLADYWIFRARLDKRRSPRTGQAHEFIVLEAPDWINIIPVTPEGNVVMIHQYRHGIEAVTLEVPGGTVEPEEPDPLEAARREMLEETGYDAAQVLPLGRVAPNPAFLNNWCYSYVALGAHRVALPQLDGAEDIGVEAVPLADVPAMIASGRISHALTINAFFFLHLFRQAHPELLPAAFLK